MIQTTTNPNLIDPILDEIHQTRQQMAEKFGGDITAILDDARQRQAASTHPIWKGPASGQVLTPTGKQPAG